MLFRCKIIVNFWDVIAIVGHILLDEVVNIMNDEWNFLYLWIILVALMMWMVLDSNAVQGGFWGITIYDIATIPQLVLVSIVS